MALQDFLASYSVEIDENSVRRLRQILRENRENASGVSEAFTSAASSVRLFFSASASRASLTGFVSTLREIRSSASSASGSVASLARTVSGFRSSLPASALRLKLEADLDLNRAGEDLRAFAAMAESMRPRLTANTSAVVSAASRALASVRAMFSGVSITIPVRFSVQKTEIPGSSGGQDPGSSKGSSSGSSSGFRSLLSAGASTGADTASGNSAASSGSSPAASLFGGLFPASPLPRYASGARVEKPTVAVVGDSPKGPEYVVPVGDDSRAVPLLRSLFRELSGRARKALFPSPESPEPFSPLRSVILPRLSEGFPAAPSGALSSATVTNTSNSVSAPVNIQVHSTGSSAEAVGKSVYDTAERYLLRAVKGVFS